MDHSPVEKKLIMDAPRMRRQRTSAEYEDAIQWIAAEDAPGDDDIIDDLQGYLTVCLVADIFNRPATMVAIHVWNIRHPEQQRGE